MIEKQFEDILIKYPGLIEDGLKLKGRQVNVRGKRVDLQFEDRHGFNLIVELKKGPIKREHIAQLMDYEGYFLSSDDPTVRVMLVGNRVPPNLRRSLDHHGFEWKEIKIAELITHLKEKGDKDVQKFRIGFIQPETADVAEYDGKYRQRPQVGQKIAVFPWHSTGRHPPPVTAGSFRAQ